MDLDLDIEFSREIRMGVDCSKLSEVSLDMDRKTAWLLELLILCISDERILNKKEKKFFIMYIFMEVHILKIQN